MQTDMHTTNMNIHMLDRAVYITISYGKKRGEKLEIMHKSFLL